VKADEAVAEFYDLLARQMFGRDLADVRIDDEKMAVIERAEAALSDWIDDQAFNSSAYEQPSAALGLLRRYAARVAELSAAEDAVAKAAARDRKPEG
jgi:hypothetical protein